MRVLGARPGISNQLCHIDEPGNLDFEPGLFANLAGERSAQRFAELDLSTRHTPFVPSWRIPPSDQQDLLPFVPYDRADAKNDVCSGLFMIHAELPVLRRCGMGLFPE